MSLGLLFRSPVSNKSSLVTAGTFHRVASNMRRGVNARTADVVDVATLNITLVFVSDFNAISF
jgi:hypothetical protein